MTDVVKNMGFWVSVKDFSFSPSEISLIVGDWITFENMGQNVHKVAEGKWESPDLLPSTYGGGQTYQKIFDKIGDFKVIDPYYDNMFIKVRVVKVRDYGMY